MTSRALPDASLSPLLTVRGLTLRFGGITALDAVDLIVWPGETLGLIGPNGAGKTSIINCISGFYRPQSGSILLRSMEITGLPPHRIAALGVARTFQNPILFPGLSVLENVLVGRHRHMTANFLTGGLYWRRVATEERRHRETALNALDIVGLTSLAQSVAVHLSIGTQKLVELARALAAEPALLLLDEPVAGLSQAEREEVAAVVERVKRDHKLTVVIIEHDLMFVRRVCERLSAFNFGRKLAEGAPAAVLHHPAVIEAYLGDGYAMPLAVEQNACMKEEKDAV